MALGGVALAAALGLLGTFGAEGSGDGQFRYPSDLALDTAGNVYVADQDNHRIQKLAPDGRLLAKFGSGSREEGQTALGAFDDPSGVAVDPAGNVWVVENDNKRVQKLAPDGSSLLTFAIGSEEDSADPFQLARAPGGDLYVTDSSGVVRRFAQDGTPLGSFGQGRLETPRGIAVAPDGTVYVADRDQFRVDVFSPTGDWLRDIKRPLSRGPLYALDVALDAAGNVWVLTDGYGLMKFSPFGRLLATVSESLRPRDRPAPNSLGVVAESGGRVLVADTQLGRLLRYGPGGRLERGAGRVLEALNLFPRAFRAGGGTTVSFVLASAARVRFTVQRRAGGRYRRLGRSFSRRGRSGPNSFRFSGRGLRPGSYRLVAKARGAGPPRRTGFRIVG